VIPPANTGKANINNIAVIIIDQTYKFNILYFNPGALKFITVTTKFIEPNIEDIPAKCKANIPKSTEHPE
jgi:hypothetical protein